MRNASLDVDLFFFFRQETKNTIHCAFSERDRHAIISFRRRLSRSQGGAADRNADMKALESVLGTQTEARFLRALSLVLGIRQC